MEDKIGTLLAIDGQAALVTGAATGIGEGIAHVLSRAGAGVVIADLDAAGAARVAQAITAAGGRAVAVEADLATLPGAEAAVTAAVAAFGGLDILVNNAGSYQGSGSIHDITPEMWRKLGAANLDTVFACAKAAARQMVAQGRGGAIVNITSVDGIHPFLGVNYDTFKAGANFFTQTLALDLAPHRIRVNAVAPGLVPVETLERVRRGELPPITLPPSVPSGLRGPLSGSRGQHIPLGRPGTSEEIGYAVLFLCSRAAGYVTGQVLAVDGGWLLL